MNYVNYFARAKHSGIYSLSYVVYRSVPGKSKNVYSLKQLLFELSNYDINTGFYKDPVSTLFSTVSNVKVMPTVPLIFVNEAQFKIINTMKVTL